MTLTGDIRIVYFVLIS